MLVVDEALTRVMEQQQQQYQQIYPAVVVMGGGGYDPEANAGRQIRNLMNVVVPKVMDDTFAPETERGEKIPLGQEEIKRFYELIEKTSSPKSGSTNSRSNNVSLICRMPNYEMNRERSYMPTGYVCFFKDPAKLSTMAFGGPDARRIGETTAMYKVISAKMGALSNKKETLKRLNKLLGQIKASPQENLAAGQSHGTICFKTRGFDVSGCSPSSSSVDWSCSSGEITSGDKSKRFEDPFKGLDSDQMEILSQHLLSKKDEERFVPLLSRDNSHVSLVSTEDGDLYICVHVSAEASCQDFMALVSHYERTCPEMTIKEFITKYPYYQMHLQNTERLASLIAYDVSVYLKMKIACEDDSLAFIPENSQRMYSSIPKKGVPDIIQRSNTMELLKHLGKGADDYRKYVDALSESGPKMDYARALDTFLKFSNPNDDHTTAVFFSKCAMNPIYHPFPLSEDDIFRKRNETSARKSFTMKRVAGKSRAQIRHNNHQYGHSAIGTKSKQSTATLFEKEEDQSFVGTMSKELSKRYGEHLISSGLLLHQSMITKHGFGPIAQSFVCFNGPNEKIQVCEIIHEDPKFIEKIDSAYVGLKINNMSNGSLPMPPAFIAFPVFGSKHAKSASTAAAAESSDSKTSRPVAKEEEIKENEKQEQPLPVSQKMNLASVVMSSASPAKPVVPVVTTTTSAPFDSIAMENNKETDCTHIYDDCDKYENTKLTSESDSYKSFHIGTKRDLKRMGYWSDSLRSHRRSRTHFAPMNRIFSKHSFCWRHPIYCAFKHRPGYHPPY